MLKKPILSDKSNTIISIFKKKTKMTLFFLFFFNKINLDII